MSEQLQIYLMVTALLIALFALLFMLVFDLAMTASRIIELLREWWAERQGSEWES